MSLPGYANAAQPMLGQLQGLANQYSSPYQQYNAQQQMAYNNALSQGWASLVKNQHKYMINGRTMAWEEWLNELAPGEDNPMRSFLTLKYKGIEKQ